MLTGGAGSDIFEITANGQTLTTDGATGTAAADTILNFRQSEGDKIRFAAGLAADGTNYEWGGNFETLDMEFAAGKVYVVTLDLYRDGGGPGIAGNEAFIIFNGTGQGIDPGANSVGALLTMTTGLQVIELRGQAGVNYATLSAGDFLFV